MLKLIVAHWYKLIVVHQLRLTLVQLSIITVLLYGKCTGKVGRVTKRFVFL